LTEKCTYVINTSEFHNCLSTQQLETNRLFL